MKEIRSILNAYDDAVQSGTRCALATVVHVDGSSYRRPGARMLITEDGKLTGSISGGCLEGDALRKALMVIESSQKLLVTYDTSDEDDAKLGMGLGCNGIIQVLIEPLIINGEDRLIALLRRAVAIRQKSALVTLFSLQNKKEPQQGTCFVLTENNMATGELPFLREVLQAEAKTVISSQKSSFKKYDDGYVKLIAFTELIVPPVSIIIAGAGNDVFPLVELAEIVGWETTVVDGRPMFAKKERFNSPGCQVLLAKPEEVLQQVKLDEHTAFLLMTHNYNYDLQLLRSIIDKQLSYIGILGPKTKTDLMLAEVSENGIALSEKQLAAIHGPVGLDIGAESAEEIALSIIAEIKAVFASKIPDSLRDREGAIHQRSDLIIENVRVEKVDRLFS